MSPVAINGIDKQGVDVNGVQVKQALADANETVNKGVYDATTLSAVDADLATGNIKSGITIFGKLGTVIPMDVSDADAAVADVKDPKTFYSVAAPRKTGTMPTVAVAADNTAYPAGYHAGAASLQAVDGDLTPANIKNGVNIFGYVGTYDTTASAPTAAQVILNKVCWANGVQITGTMPTVALDPAANAYPAGYHVGAASLTAVDADLATGNIKSGITIFGVAGAVTVQEIGAADAAVTDVKAPRTFFSVTGAIKTGTMPTVAITNANDNYPAGYHAGDAGGLDAIDLDLASANIKSGVTIFGKAGAATVQDISAANALVTDVLAPKTFFSVTGAIKTGTMATVALSAAANAYPAGYHVGAASLTAVDGDLVTGSIKSGVTIFGVAGAVTVQDIADADLTVAEAPTGKKFYAVTGGVKTGTGTKTLNPANETVAAGYYAATTLSAVDIDLAVGNIKSGVTIFGFLGTYVSTLAEDIVASAETTQNSNSSGEYFIWIGLATNSDTDFATTTNTFATNSMAVAVGFINAHCTVASSLKLRLYMNGVQIAESAYFSTTAGKNYIVVGTAALSGSKICKIGVHNYSGSTSNIYLVSSGSNFGYPIAAGIGVGSIKITA